MQYGPFTGFGSETSMQMDFQAEFPETFLGATRC